jgi:hypothetical protein
MTHEVLGTRGLQWEYLPRAVDKANHGAENLHHDRVVVLPIILKHVLEFVRPFTPS